MRKFEEISIRMCSDIKKKKTLDKKHATWEIKDYQCKRALGSKTRRNI